MDVAAALARSPLFGALAAADLARLAALAEPVALACGERLYAEGDPPDHLYVLLSGRLRVTAGGQLLGYIDRLEPAGEVGVLADAPRSTTIHALRDSVVARIGRAPLLEFLAAQAPTLLALSRFVLNRLRRTERQRRTSPTARGGRFAIVPAAPGMPTAVLASALVRRLGGWPHARLLGPRHVDAALGAGAAQAPYADAAGSGRLAAWLDRMEERHPYLVCVADAHDDAWALRCVRNADRVLVVAEAGGPAQPPAALAGLTAEQRLARVELVLLRPHGDSAPAVRELLARCGALAHYFVHPWDADDLAALARQIAGRGVGLVLGGGGARGFAHIGLIRALAQLQIPVDITGGTSMGAFIAALLACGFDTVEMREIARESFVSSNYLNDYTLPRVSLIRGQRFLARLREIFGEQRIEELRRTYFCVSTNLTTGAAVVHDHGPLAEWVATSMAVPGVAPPIAWNGELLCDGGVVDNLPTAPMQALERGAIVACSVAAIGDLRAPGAGLTMPDPHHLLTARGTDPRPGLGEILLRSATLTSDTVFVREAVGRADVCLHMPVQSFGMFAWKRLDELIAIGHEHALAQLEPLRDSLLGAPGPDAAAA